MAAMFGLFKRSKEPVVVTPVEPASESMGLPQMDDANTVGGLYPGVRHLAVNMSIRSPDNEIEPSLNNRSFGPQSRAYFHFRCKNVDCVDGGFDLDELLQQAIEAGNNDVSGRRVCQGWRNADMAGHQKCYYELNFKIHISYTG